MAPSSDSFHRGGRLTEVDFALGRRPDRIYVSKAFVLDLWSSRDRGRYARYVHRVFDESAEDPSARGDDICVSEESVVTTPRGRKQIKLQITREAGAVRELQIQRVPTDPSASKMEVLLKLDRSGSARLVELIRALDHIPIEGGEETVRLDEEVLREVFRSPVAMQELYGRDPDRFRRLIRDDASARDLLAVAHRQTVVAEFRELLSDETAFQEAVQECGSREGVWQRLLENNPWILGISLAGQLLTGWSPKKLEQVVAGFSIAGAGKRADALLRTSGQIRTLVFAEIKHHQTPLLASGPYRSATWAPSSELTGGLTQAQQTVHRAASEIGERLLDRDESGAETGDVTFLVRPRSFLIAGDLSQLRGEKGGVNPDKFRSFELFRRNLYEPEIITFDELLARAEWHAAMADKEETGEDDWDDVPF